MPELFLNPLALKSIDNDLYTEKHGIKGKYGPYILRLCITKLNQQYCPEYSAYDTRNKQCLEHFFIYVTKFVMAVARCAACKHFGSMNASADGSRVNACG